MQAHTSRWLAALAALAVSALAPGASAEDTGAEAIDPDEGTPRPAAPDQRAGHLLISGEAGLLGPAGSVASDLPVGVLASAGFRFGGTLGLGLSRGAVLELGAGYGLLGGGCDDGCTASTFDARLGMAYHLVQGLAIDPWMSFGAGYRSSSFTVPPPAGRTTLLGGDLEEATFHGVDFARIALGATFRPVPSFGLGPFVGLDLGTYVARDAAETTVAGVPAQQGSVYAFLQVGVRLTLDPFGWDRASAAPSQRGRTRSPAPRSGGETTPPRAAGGEAPAQMWASRPRSSL